ncbi:hypothetical protein [Gloeothece verrucosa]|uniref:Uncharacterized protein n=1 Tax=Gloeothece verrucosa (strain PCC 7822) TaxID=497965 RepID=E0U8C4_GLOV7|nr:hypothetical protein [Gloeothece verrucosa]ADN12560.1 hypothetical protein Cyan7822_0520 [Gloeothece verrucosa PCC 7822]
MSNFNFNLGSTCRRALINHQIYRKVEEKYQEIRAKRRQCCRNCAYFDNNPYLPCAIDPIQAAMADEDNFCKYFERKEE